MDEWTKFANSINVDLFQVSDAIRKRNTHSNIRYPGLGVGGYCLTKDQSLQRYHQKKSLNSKNCLFLYLTYQ